VLPEGTVIGTLPTVTYTPAPNATAVKTDPTDLPGTTTIVVTAQDGIHTNTYTISFTVLGAKTPQTISMNTLSTITYGDADVALGAMATSGLPVTISSSNLYTATIVSGKLHIVAAGTTTLTLSQAGDDTYKPATNVVQAITVNKAMLTVTATDTTRAAGKANPNFRLAYSGFKGTDNVSSIDQQPLATCTASKFSPVGVYDIVVDISNALDNNYAFTPVNGKLTVTSNAGVNALASQDIKVYPNPVGSYLNISNLLPGQTISLCSISGKELLKTKAEKTVTGIDMNKYAPGVYLIKITTNDGVVVKLVTKQ
jgi:hypothetical protein